MPSPIASSLNLHFHLCVILSLIISCLFYLFSFFVAYHRCSFP
jgi:hypothetical protein